MWEGAVTTRAGALEKETTTEVPILMYHSIADDGPAELSPIAFRPHFASSCGICGGTGSIRSASENGLPASLLGGHCRGAR